MNIKGTLACVLLPCLLSAGCASLSLGSSSKIPITVKGEMSTVVLSIVERQNSIQEGERIYTHPDGLVFYFVIYPAYRSYSYPTIREAQPVERRQGSSTQASVPLMFMD
jgi:hypothetical protein